jgi:hypothetical protein
VNFIMDALIAEGKARPMLVVMDQGYATRAGAAPAPAAAPAGQSGAGGGQPDAFQDVVLRDLIPAVDAAYRTLTDRRNRAIAGLSMGPARRCGSDSAILRSSPRSAHSAAAELAAAAAPASIGRPLTTA